MKTKLLFAFFLFSVSLLFAQKKYVIGNVKNEVQNNIPQTYIYNPRTEEVVVTDQSGDFIIAAIPSDELRIVKKGFERLTLKIKDDNFTNPLQLVLSKLPFEIEEVTIAFIPTGDLKKDLAYFKTSAKTEKLNNEISKYVMGPMTEVIPQNKIPSSFAPKNYGEGQMNILGLASALKGLIGKATTKPNNTPNYAEVEDFYRRVKDVVDLDYYKSYGMSEYDFDIFLAYVDHANSLAKKYHKNFNRAIIESELKMALVEYIKTHKVGS
ncbi:hypothetical protein [Kaistella sp.]|uniref:hypothetical protein n=1 Tax=Kaistella sp. TaxID=2782235 RepID=UPI003C5E7884